VKAWLVFYRDYEYADDGGDVECCHIAVFATEDAARKVVRESGGLYDMEELEVAPFEK